VFLDFRRGKMIPDGYMKTIRSLLLVWGCACAAWGAGPAFAAPGQPANDIFNAYWYQGKAEITSYTLEQARYGEIHQGHAVLIFVTEDFSRKKQVKLDDPGSAGADRVNVLKLNLTKKFNTGIYPYSMMTSVFTPVDRAAHPRTFKITTSSQEWCGHTFTQLNLSQTGDGYQVQQHSYFESEGDQSLTLPGAILEDELWATIRLDPAQLPTGELRLIPGAMFQRLRHLPWGPQRATAKLEVVAGDHSSMAYTITYPDLQRTLTIHFNKAFPHEIEGWQETYLSGWGQGARRLTTRAKRSKRVLSDYWHKNRNVDRALRQDLGLD